MTATWTPGLPSEVSALVRSDMAPGIGPIQDLNRTVRQLGSAGGEALPDAGR